MDDEAGDSADLEKPLLSPNTQTPNYTTGEKRAEEPREDSQDGPGLATRCLECLGWHTYGAGAVHCRVVCTVSYKEASGARTFMTHHSSKRAVGLFVRDDTAFAKEAPMEFVVPREDDAFKCAEEIAGFPEDVECALCLEFDHDDNLQMEAEPVDVSDAIKTSHGHLVVFLHDDDGNYRGRVHMEAEYDTASQHLALRIKHVSQLHLPDTKDSSQSMVAGRQRLVLLALIVHVGGGLLFFVYYVRANVVDSLLFISSLIVVTGVTDIVDTTDPVRADGTKVYDREVVRWFLIFYMIFGVVILFTFVSAYFTSVMHHINRQLTALHVFGYGTGDSTCRRYTMGLVTGKLGSYIVGVLLIFLSNAIALTMMEGWTFLDSSYFTVSTMISVGFVDDLKVASTTGKIWLSCWMPLANLTFFYLLSEYLGEQAKNKQEMKRQAALQGALQQPEDLIALADEAGDGTVSKYEYVKFILLHVGDVEHDEMLAIEERFDQMDRNGDGRIEAWELGPEGLRSPKVDGEEAAGAEEQAGAAGEDVEASIIKAATEKAKKKHQARNSPRPHHDEAAANAASETH